MAKNDKLKQRKVVNEDVTQVRNLLIILGIVVVVCIGLYFLTDKIVDSDKTMDEEVKEVEFNYDIATIGTMFNRPEDEYYVILYSSKDDGILYDGLLSSYRSSDNYIKTYFIDLDLKANNVLSETLEKKPNSSKDVTVTGPTLYKLKKGKVTNCYSTYDEISNVLK